MRRSASIPRLIVALVSMAAGCRSPGPPPSPVQPVTPAPTAPPAAPVVAPRAPLRVDPTTSFRWIHTVTLAEQSAFPFRTDTVTRRDSTRTEAVMTLQTRTAASQLHVLLMPSLGLLESRDTLGYRVSSRAEPEPTVCPAPPAPVFARWLVAPRNHDGKLDSLTLESAFARCAGAVPLSGQIGVHWGVPEIAGDGRYRVSGSVSGGLRADSSTALPLAVRGTIEGTALLTGRVDALIGDSLTVRYRLTYRATNARMSQTLLETGVTAFNRPD